MEHEAVNTIKLWVVKPRSATKNSLRWYDDDSKGGWWQQMSDMKAIKITKMWR